MENKQTYLEMEIERMQNSIADFREKFAAASPENLNNFIVAMEQNVEDVERLRVLLEVQMILETDGTTPQGVIEYVTHEAMRKARYSVNSTSKLSNFREDTERRVWAELAFDSGFSNSLKRLLRDQM